MAEQLQAKTRIARLPIDLPKGVDITLNGQDLALKGSKGAASLAIHPAVKLLHEDNALRVLPRDNSKQTNALTGTMASLVKNYVKGVSEGFERKLLLVGVGYRAQLKGKELHLTLGLSHPVVFTAPEGVELEVPAQTEILVKGVDKQQVGQVSAQLRSLRPPEPYKGKGIRYADEQISLKETKKK